MKFFQPRHFRTRRRLEVLLEEMRGKNLDLVAELEGLRIGSEGSKYESPKKTGRKGGEKIIGISPEKKMSPVMNESLAKKHEEVVERLLSMKSIIKEELTPGKRRKVSGGVKRPGVGSERGGADKSKILARMEKQIEVLLVELGEAKDALVGKDELLVELGNVIEQFEEDRVERQEEYEEMESYVERCEGLVEKELEWRKRSEEEFELVKIEVELLRRENEVSGRG